MLRLQFKSKPPFLLSYLTTQRVKGKVSLKTPRDIYIPSYATWLWATRMVQAPRNNPSQMVLSHSNCVLLVTSYCIHAFKEQQVHSLKMPDPLAPYANLAGFRSLLASASRSYRTILMYLTKMLINDRPAEDILRDKWGW